MNGICDFQIEQDRRYKEALQRLVIAAGRFEVSGAGEDSAEEAELTCSSQNLSATVNHIVRELRQKG